MISLKQSIFIAAASFAGVAALRAETQILSGTFTLHDLIVDEMPATKSINMAGNEVTTVTTCTGEVRKTIVHGRNGEPDIVTTFSYSAGGLLISRRDATGAGTDYEYDQLGRCIKESDAKIPGKVRTYTYDKVGHRLTSTDASGVTTTFEYDVMGRLVKESMPMSATETRVYHYGYDALGHLIAFTDANGGVTRWEFDSVGRNIAKTYPNGDHRTMAYDPVGRLVKLTDENGDTIASTYNLLGQLTSKHYSKDNSTDTFEYDAGSRIIAATKGRYGHTLRYTYDNAGRLATETHPDGAVTRFEYDPANRLAKLTHAGSAGTSSASTVLYGFDGRGLLSTVSAGDYATRYEYRINGQLASTVDYRVATPQGDILRADRSYDAGARLLGVTNTAANGDQAGVVYTLGNDDQRLTATEETGARWNYTYDQLKQLTAATKTDTNAVTIPPLDQAYAYDPMGNRRTYTEPGKTIAYTANSANQYAAITETPSGGAQIQNNWVHDKNGNLLNDGARAYTWDADNQLTSVTPLYPAAGAKKVAFSYDWRGRRITKSVATFVAGIWQATGGSDFKYHEWNPIEETIVAGSTTEKKNYVWGNDLSGNLHGAGGVGGLLSMKYNNESYFYAYDGNGNVRAMVKADAASPAASAITARSAYDGFGKEVAVSGADADKNAFKFSTKQLDGESDMNYYGYRYFSSRDGRWTNRDPLMELGGKNIYYTCGNSLTNSFDYLGLDCSTSATNFNNDIKNPNSQIGLLWKKLSKGKTSCTVPIAECVSCGSRGEYKPGSNKIFLNENSTGFDKTLIHELTHAGQNCVSGDPSKGGCSGVICAELQAKFQEFGGSKSALAISLAKGSARESSRSYCPGKTDAEINTEVNAQFDSCYNEDWLK